MASKLGWKRVTSEEQIEELLSRFGRFHDGCLREVHIWTETYVSKDMRMSAPSHLDTHVRMLIQRQWRDPSAVELVFHEVTGFHLSPSPENYLSDIFEASLTIQDGAFRWTDAPGSSHDDKTTWVTARELWWRDASEWIGPDLRYGPELGAPATESSETTV